MESLKNNDIAPKLGDGIFLIKDVSKILHLDYSKVRRWILGYWDGHLIDNFNYTFGEKGNKAINFYSLIEFYTFFKLREKGLSPHAIRKLHDEMIKVFNTRYPFATAQDYFVEKRNKKKVFVYYKYLESLIKSDKKHQFSLNFLEKFLERVEFDDNNLAKRFFPLENSKNVVVDPKHQFGQPTIVGTNIKTQSIYNLYKGGESYENICNLYNLEKSSVKDAVAFHKSVA